MSIVLKKPYYFKIREPKNHNTLSTPPYTKNKQRNKFQKAIFSQPTFPSQILPSKKIEKIQNQRGLRLDSLQTEVLKDPIFPLPLTSMDVEFTDTQTPSLSTSESDISTSDDSPSLDKTDKDKENQDVLLEQRDVEDSQKKQSPSTQSDSDISNSKDSPLSEKADTNKPFLTPIETSKSFSRRPLKNSSLHWNMTFNNTTISSCQDTEKFISDLMKILKALEVPEEFIKIDKVSAEDSFQSKTHVTITLSWRELKALCLQSKELETLLLKGQSLNRLRPLMADSQADNLVKTARAAIGNNSTGKRTPSWELYENSSFKEILNSAFEDFQGICFGEMHDQPKTFLIDYLKHMKTCGVEILFMEHLLYDTTQAFLDKYFLDAPDAEMPIPLAAYLKTLDEDFDLEESDHSFTALVKAAKAHGIRVVGIDTSLSYEAGYDRFGSGGIDRYLAMNYVAKQIIEWEAGVFTKYAALMGYFHGATASACGKGVTISADDSVPGVAEMLEVPFIILEANKENASVEHNVSNYKNSISFVNMVISQSGE